MAFPQESDRDQLVQCCYNKSHMVARYRLQTHLCKCRKQYGKNVLSICPFNSTHNVYAPELQFHIESCPDRRELDAYLYIKQQTNAVTKVPDVQMPVSSENWDEQPECSSYLDEKEKILSDLPVLREPPGKSRSYRRKFYTEQMKKFNTIQNDDELQKPNSSMPTTKKIIKLSDDSIKNNYEEIRIGMGRGMKIELSEMEKLSSPSRPGSCSYTMDDLDDEEDIFED